MASSNVDADDYPSNESQQCNSEDLSSKTEEFLNSKEIALTTDPKLKREKQKLNELLESYKKLIDKLDKKFENNTVKAEHVKKLHKIPEIFAILHPELYKNPREEEKKRLISKFSKRQFSDIDKIVAPVYRTPPVNVSDVRQEEKERLIKILSSSPAHFLNTYDTPLPTKKIQSSKSYSLSPNCFRNKREAEKERLVKILATSSTYNRKSLDPAHSKSTGRSYVENVIKKHDKDLKSLPVKKCYVNGVPVPLASTNQEVVISDAYDSGEMVRAGEYSPLSSNEKSRILFGYGEHEERRSQLLAERRKEYKHFLSNNLKEAQEKVDKALSTADNEPEEIENEQKRSRCHSISTQTEDHLDSVEKKEMSPYKTTSQNICNGMNISPRQQMYYLSPREKLMSDLHGVSRCFPGATASNDKSTESQDIKLRQAAYAKALQEQIEEKRKLEEKRKMKEKEEDELIEQRMRMQQEKIQSEVSYELKKKQDWIAQRQSQEEILRRKMLEMKLEAQELKKQQSRKKKLSDTTSEIKALPVSAPQTTLSEPTYRGDFMKPQTTLSEPSHSRDLEDVMGRVHMLPEHNFKPIERAPLLEADRQNILCSGTRQSVSYHTPKSSSRAMVNAAYDLESRNRGRERAEELLRAPLDFRIDSPVSPPNATDLIYDRPPSPPIPALRTRDIINNNSKVLEDKWKIPGQGRELNRTQANQDNILTQLGAFRRQLQQEHMKLEARLQKQASP